MKLAQSCRSYISSILKFIYYEKATDPLVLLVLIRLSTTLYQNKHERPSPYRQSGLPCTISATALPACFTPFVFVHGPVGICTRQRIRKAYHTLFTLAVTCRQGHVLKRLFKWMKEMGAGLGWVWLAPKILGRY